MLSMHPDKIIPRVVDLSHYDDVQDKFAGAVEFGIWGVINKVTEGVGTLDKSFAWRRQPAKDAGLLFGAYHFLRPGRIEDQVSWFLENIGDPQGMLLAIDHETEYGSHASVDELKLCLSMIHDKVHRWPWLYSGDVIKSQLGTSVDPFWRNIKLWLPQYGSHYDYPFAFANPPLWQYSGDGFGPPPHNVPGIVIGGGGIDMNHFAGPRDQLAAIWAA